MFSVEEELSEAAVEDQEALIAEKFKEMVMPSKQISKEEIEKRIIKDILKDTNGLF